ncbi:F-box/LRR-repeat protein 20-like isoform X1 [Phymastichus coffea]|uniref:F-box/LRR-repeat protein 20-like isoform X1 n=1 Tax=Phymastichus coffea TaxID=108790 RepID=UPI00273AD4C6|nr:F-box/LRR-repeat protein 20-like isoform X1 [Phymastichus coffea]
MSRKSAEYAFIYNPVDYYLRVSSVDVLNNDCLLHIFQLLPIVDRVRSERVCKRWQLLMQESWRDFKDLNFENECWGFSNKNAVLKVNSRILKKVLKRCGQYIKNIEFPELNNRLGPHIMKLIAKFCANVENIFATELEVSSWSIRALSENCHKIIVFYIGNCSDECDDELGNLFKENKGLKEIYIHSNLTVTGKCLSQLNTESIETICFDNCPYISLKYFSVVKECKNLKEIVVEHFHDSNDRAIENICECSESLKHLTLALCPFYTKPLNNLTKLINLEILDLLSNGSVDDELLVAIGAHCKQLRKVDISYCGAVTDVGVSSIMSLPNLVCLSFEECNNVTDQVFHCMPNLKHLDCSNCSNLKDAGLIRLIETCEKLEHLYLNCCKSLTNEFLIGAIKATKNRKNKVILKCYLSYTAVVLSGVDDTSKLLQVVPKIVITPYNL